MSLKAQLAPAARAPTYQHSPRVSAFPARLVRLPCDSCPAWRRLVTRTHRLMLVSPRKQNATVSGRWGAAAGAQRVVVTAGLCLLVQTHTDKKGQEEEVADTSRLTTRGPAYRCSHSALAPRHQAAKVHIHRESPRLPDGAVSPSREEGRPGQGCVTMCKAVPSQASVSLFVRGGCQTG